MRIRFIPVFLVLLFGVRPGDNPVGCLRILTAAEDPGSELTLIESIRQAGRQKHAAESLRYLDQAQKLLTTSDIKAVDSKERTALHWCVLSAQSASGARQREA